MEGVFLLFFSPPLLLEVWPS